MESGAGASETEKVATVGPGMPADFQGNYELFGLVCHKGRLADGGHYTGWVRQDGDDWLVPTPHCPLYSLLFTLLVF